MNIDKEEVNVHMTLDQFRMLLLYLNMIIMLQFLTQKYVL